MATLALVAFSSDSSTLTVNNSTISDNSSGYGAIYNAFGTLTLNHSTVSNNSAEGNASGMMMAAASTTAGTLTLNNSTISNNSAQW